MIIRMPRQVVPAVAVPVAVPVAVAVSDSPMIFRTHTRLIIDDRAGRCHQKHYYRVDTVYRLSDDDVEINTMTIEL